MESDKLPLRMTWIRPFEMNMDVSRGLLERSWDNVFLATAQKVALYTVIPFVLIAAFEAIVKNLLLINLANLGITLLNTGHDLYKRINCFGN